MWQPISGLNNKYKGLLALYDSEGNKIRFGHIAEECEGRKEDGFWLTLYSENNSHSFAVFASREEFSHFMTINRNHIDVPKPLKMKQDSKEDILKKLDYLDDKLESLQNEVEKLKEWKHNADRNIDWLIG